MRYRRFGKTEWLLSVFSLGTMRYLASPDIARQIVEKAVHLGINHLETARGYGNSELYLGQALRSLLGSSQNGQPPRRRSELVVTTKIPPTLDAAEMAIAIDESLERLGLDYVDGLALHGINTEEHLAAVQRPQGCMVAVAEAVAEGKVRHVGFSTHAPLDIIVRAIATEQFEFVNLHYTLLFQRNQAAVELAYQHDMGVFIISPADKGGLLYTPSDTLRQLCAPLTPLALNARFLLGDRRITTLSVGPAVPEELDEPLQVADQDHPLTPEERDLIAGLERHQGQVLGNDRCSQCHECLPCPEAINIPEVLRLRNLAVAYDMSAFGQYRYRMFENAGHWFPGRKGDRCTDCGDCLPRCPEQLEIPRLLRDTHERLNGPKRRRLWGD